jgi:serine/threonine protein phosphatase PrpC
MAIALRYAARSDVGLVRNNNQDSGYAGPHLLVIADGMGGHAGGDVASSLAIGELAPLDAESHGADALGHLSQAVYAAHRELLDRVSQEPNLTGMGTTITALLRTGARLALAHIGDSRAYLLRDGELVQITRDHTFVQRLVDDGRLTPEEAEQHPQRSVLMRVLSDVVDDVEPDLSMREARIGDRYLLCSDGLSGVVSFETLRDTLAAGKDPAATCEQLVQLALRGGAPDNVTCIVADVVEATGGPPTDTVPSVVGAASTRRQQRITTSSTPAERAAELTSPRRPPEDEEDHEEPSRRSRFRGLRLTLTALVLLGVLAGGAYGAYRWTQLQFFVGNSEGQVAIFRGLPQDIGPIQLSSVDEVFDDLPVADLGPYYRQQVEKGIVADDETEAKEITDQLRAQIDACRAEGQTTPTPTATGSPGPSATASPTPTAKTSDAARPNSSVSPTGAAGGSTPEPGSSVPAGQDCAEGLG